MRLIQILGEGIEELYNVPDDVTDENIKELYSHYKQQNDYETFEEYLDEYCPQMQMERVFVDEIYVD
jgi:hypothetical protein